MSVSSAKDILKRKSIAFMVLSAGCWGLETVMSKGALEQLLPLTLLNLQLIASVVFLWIMVALGYFHRSFRGSKVLRFKPLLTWKTMAYALSGLLEPGFAYTLGHIGLTMTTASNATLISTAEPVIITGLAALLLKERVGILLLMLSMTAIAGVFLTIGFAPQLSRDSLIGDSLIALGTCCAAFYVISSHRGVKGLDPLPLAAMQQSAGLAWIVLMWLVLERSENIQLASVSPTVWGLVIASGIIQFSLAFWLYLIALQGISASLAAQFLTLIPIFGVCGAYVFLGERLTIIQGLGMFLIISAVYAMTRLKATGQ
ncbi:DMT family transporter [Leptolyngbya sp. FACHB-261]|uniref:DMT family transporter n=1 Tax=Leptolyngbya sp. FACHB-261 TaxID=2692806 RepID=UPI001688EDA4|nr:DMT family transporter [Leptolyngbya sp. FACHB-261]MBD2105190.1 DMT family transporter [Leptolyngbya sp. FACHB-261]